MVGRRAGRLTGPARPPGRLTGPARPPGRPRARQLSSGYDGVVSHPPSAVSPAWLDADPGSLAPTVLVIGGFITSANWYGGLADALRERGVAEVVVASIWTPDWILAAFRGIGPITTRAGRALLRASEASAASPRSLGAPLLVVGHSAGGTLGRLLTSPVPFEGRRLNASGRIGALVTLGTPHLLGPDVRWGSRMSRAGARFAERHVPGAYFAPTTGYLAVASRLIVGRLDGEDGRSRFARGLYEGILPQPEREAVEGDGLVPVEFGAPAGSPTPRPARREPRAWPAQPVVRQPGPARRVVAGCAGDLARGARRAPRAHRDASNRLIGPGRHSGTAPSARHPTAARRPASPPAIPAPAGRLRCPFPRLAAPRAGRRRSAPPPLSPPRPRAVLARRPAPPSHAR